MYINTDIAQLWYNTCTWIHVHAKRFHTCCCSVVLKSCSSLVTTASSHWHTQEACSYTQEEYLIIATKGRKLLTWTFEKSTRLRSATIWLICEAFWRTARAAWARWLSEVYLLNVWENAITEDTFVYKNGKRISLGGGRINSKRWSKGGEYK